MNYLQGVQSNSEKTQNIVRSACVNHDSPNAINELALKLNPEELEIVILFVSPLADAKQIIHAAKAQFSPARVVGCTTAGEISASGYSAGEIVAVGFPRSNFKCQELLIDNLDDFSRQSLIDQMILNRHDMGTRAPDWNSEFTFILIDGMSTREDELISQIAVGLGPVPMFGGSAGDGDEFGQTFILHDGQSRSNAAVIIQFRSNCPVSVFKTDHFIPTDKRMVVTAADPAARRVSEINAEPAAREYARILGKDPEQLTTMTFAAHPVVVRLGGQHHVRSIQQVAENGDLIFFSAIDEGMVLSLADAENMVDHLEREMGELSKERTPDTILACDCILRRIEAQQKQLISPISKVLVKNRVIGFCTYGEQFNSMHVNQTLTGVAIYPPEKPEQ